MRGLVWCGRLSAIGFFLVFSAVPQAQNLANAQQTLAVNSAAAQPLSGTGSRAVVKPPLPPLSMEDNGDPLEYHKRHQAAIDAYSSVEPRTATIWNKMGIAYQMMGDAKDAQRCYQKPLKLEPANAHAINNLATVEDTLLQYSAAERNYRKALRIEPRSALMLKNLGTNLIMQHEYGRGADAYAQALAINPHIFDTFTGPVVTAPEPVFEHGTTNYFKARSCARVGLTDCALTHLRKAFNEGTATLKKVANENDFEGLRENRGFEQLLAEQK